MLPGTPNSNRADESASEPVFYVTDLSKATLAEIWQVTEGRLRDFLLICLAKLSGKPLRFGAPSPADVAAIIELHEVPEDIRHSYEPLMKPLLHAGFIPKFAMAKRKSEPTKVYATVLLSSDRITVAVVVFTKISDRTLTLLQLTSKRADNSLVATNNSPRILRLPPEIKAVNLNQADAETVLVRHRRRIAALTDLLPIGDSAARAFVTGLAERITDFRIECGLCVPATEEEMRRHGLIAAD